MASDETPADQATEPEQAMSEETYMAERKLLIDVEHSGAQQHDKAILTLSAAALGLSISFIQHVAPTPVPASYAILYLSWFFFILAISAILYSFLTSQSACRRQRALLDIEYSTGSTPSDQTNAMADFTRHLNTASYVLFLLGVLCLTIFSSVNLPESSSSHESVQEQSAQNG